MIPKDFPRPNQARRHESPSGARGRGFGAGSVVTPTRTNSTASAAALAESIGLTPNQAATGIALMRSGRCSPCCTPTAGPDPRAAST